MYLEIFRKITERIYTQDLTEPERLDIITDGLFAIQIAIADPTWYQWYEEAERNGGGHRIDMAYLNKTLHLQQTNVIPKGHITKALAIRIAALDTPDEINNAAMDYIRDFMQSIEGLKLE